MAGGLICGVVGYSITAYSTNIWEAYFGYAVLGGIGSGMVYSSAINIVAKWYPEKKGWRTGFVNGGWAYGAVPFIFIIGAASTGSGSIDMTTSQVKNYIIIQGIIMTVGIALGGWFMKDPQNNDLCVLGQRSLPVAHPRCRTEPQRPDVRHLRDHLRRLVRRHLPDDRRDGGGLLRRDQQRRQLRVHLCVEGARRQLRRRRR